MIRSIPNWARRNPVWASLLAVAAGIAVLLAVRAIRAGLAGLNVYVSGLIGEAVLAAGYAALLLLLGQGRTLTHWDTGLLRSLWVGGYYLIFSACVAVAGVLAGLRSGSGSNPPGIVLAGIGLFLLAGVAEELLFRGIIADLLLQKFGGTRRGVWTAALLAALLFALMHLMNYDGSNLQSVLVQVAAVFFTGLSLNAVYYRTGNLYALMLLHGLFDLASDLGNLLFARGDYLEDLSAYGWESLLGAVPMLLLTLFLLWGKKCREIVTRQRAAQL